MDPLEPFLFAMDTIFMAAIKATPFVETVQPLTADKVIEEYKHARALALAAVKS